MDRIDREPGFAESVALVGNTLGPFFSHDPKLDAELLQPLANQITSLDATEAGNSWPFVQGTAAAADIALMQEGLKAGLVDEALYREYRRLFVGPAKKVAPPWGSVYTDRDEVMFGESTMALRSWLKRNGIHVEVSGGDMPEDHIGTMLGLMAWIAEERPELLEEFLGDHLLTWSGHFLGIVADKTTHPFYLGLSKLADGSLEGIRETLNLAVEYPRFYR